MGANLLYEKLLEIFVIRNYIRGLVRYNALTDTIERYGKC